MDPLPWYRIIVPVVAVLGLAIVAALRPDLPRLRAMLLGIGMLVGYAILQDQVSTRLCPEYFTVLHNPIPGVTDPTLLGIAWGFLGSCGGGAILGLAAGLASTLGPKPQLPVRALVRPMAVLVLAIATATAVAGFVAHYHAEMFQITIDPFLAERISPDRHRAAFVVACYHMTAYLASIIGSVVLCIWIARCR